MAMNEDSVVSSLNELRRMANERARREAEQRARSEAERRAFEDRGRAGRRSESRARVAEARSDPRTRTLTEGFPEPKAAEAFSSMVRWESQDGQSPAPEQGMYAPTAPIAATQEWRTVRGEQAAMAAPARSGKSVVGPVLLTALVLGAAGLIGYIKLHQDFQATLRARDTNMARLEETKNQAVEAAARAEQQTKVQANLYEQRLRAQMPGGAPAGGNPAAAAPAAPAGKRWGAAAMAAAAKPAPARFHRRWWRSRGAGRRAAAAAAAAADEKKPNLPSIARKKKINDDPLDGLKL